jgi:hypothetical protein
MSRKVRAAILAHREVAPLLSDEHFSVSSRQIALQSPDGQWTARW